MSPWGREGCRVLYGDLNPRPPLFLLLYCPLSPVRPSQVSNLCVCVGRGDHKKGGEGPGRKA